MHDVTIVTTCNYCTLTSLTPLFLLLICTYDDLYIIINFTSFISGICSFGPILGCYTKGVQVKSAARGP